MNPIGTNFPNYKQLSIKIEKPMFDELARRSRKDGMTLSKYVSCLIMKDLCNYHE